MIINFSICLNVFHRRLLHMRLQAGNGYFKDMITNGVTYTRTSYGGSYMSSQIFDMDYIY